MYGCYSLARRGNQGTLSGCSITPGTGAPEGGERREGLR